MQQVYAQLRDLYDKKLWHQLTEGVEAAIALPYLTQQIEELYLLYDRFIRDFELKINQLKLVTIVVVISRRLAERQLDVAIQLLEKISARLPVETEKEAYCLSLTECAFIKITRVKDLKIEEIKGTLEKVHAILESITGADAIVYSSYYRLQSTYHKVKVSSTEFYRNSLLYLVYTPASSIPLQDQQQLAFDVGMAALVSKDIHNFGELLAHPILQSLDGTNASWLKEFLFIFNSGNIGRFEAFTAKHREDIQRQPVLQANLVFLRQKISLLALMELVFIRPPDQRTISFRAVAEAVKIKEDEVEILAMRGMALKLIRGSIDQIAQTITITWVQARVLDMQQITGMRDRVADWTTNVQQLLNFIESESGTELLV